jgi:glycosidase
MKNFKNPSDAMVREDFPGGFPGDPDNKFLASGRNAAENAAFDFVSRLAEFRKKSSALTHGKMMQYIPVNGLYVYFRYDASQTILCALNTDSAAATIHYNEYQERIKGFAYATDIMTGKTYPVSEKMEIPARSIRILELKKTAN